MAEIVINGTPFTYVEEVINYENNFPITIEDGKLILETAKKLFDQVNIDFYLVFGTLLGAIRDKTIIKGDEDIDVFVCDENKLRHNIPYFYNNGLKLCRYIKGQFYSFRINERCYLDVYILRPIQGFNIWKGTCFYLNKNVTPKKFFRKYQTIRFLDGDYKCPKNPEALLEFWYGKSWRIPIKGHKFIYEVKSHYYWAHNIKPLLFELILWPYWRHLLSNKFNTLSESLSDWKSYRHNLKQ